MEEHERNVKKSLAMKRTIPSNDELAAILDNENASETESSEKSKHKEKQNVGSDSEQPEEKDSR